MKNPKKIAATNGEFWLPEAVIQQIQSFLSEKQAAQTSILSKSWYSAWLTRPNLVFDQCRSGCDYISYEDVIRFLESARKTMQRYEESKLKLESFRLSMDRKQRESCIIGDELTAKALKLGATKLFLSVRLGYSTFPMTLNACEFRNLKFLWLECLNIDPVFSDDSPSELPSMKVLELHSCFSKKGIRISSVSLERISFAHNNISRATLDVPNIRKFTFATRMTLPSLAFERASGDWVTDLSIEWRGNYFKTSWFHELEKFLEGLSLSKISLFLEIGLADKVLYNYAPDFQSLAKPVVENLTIKLHRKYITGDGIFKCLFGSCGPKFITQCWEDLQRRGWSWRVDDNVLRLLCKTLMLDVSENCCVPNRNTSRLPGLEEVHVECFEETLAKWRPLSLKTLLDASTSLEDKQLIRFRLKWR
ncbi:hypothetical protein OROMI_027836 [Orobanche minor]